MSRRKLHVPVKYDRVNIAGRNIKKFRREKFPGLSQNGLASLVQLQGIPMTKNTIQRMESGTGTINDIQLVIFAKVLEVSVADLLDESLWHEEPKPFTYKKPDSAENLPDLAVAEKEPEYS